MNTTDFLSDFASWLAMGGYGVYVWGSLGMCLAVFIAEGWSLRARRRALRSELTGEEVPASAQRQPVLTHREAA